VRSAYESKEVADFLDEQLRLLEGGEVPALVWLVPVADVGEASLAQRREGRCSSLGKIEQPVATVTVSLTSPEIHSLTCLMLSQYRRADDAPVAGSQ
jgi:hypothetical protein